MKFGISVSQINEVDLAVAAERVGYDFCWVWDSPMIRSNLWAVLALVADRTSTIRVGSGVAVPDGTPPAKGLVRGSVMISGCCASAGAAETMSRTIGMNR